MDLKLFFSTFLLIFLAELGDKTQLATMTLAAKEKAYPTIFIAAVLGFALATIVAIVVGVFGAKVLPPEIIQKIAGALFVLVGILILLNKF